MDLALNNLQTQTNKQLSISFDNKQYVKRTILITCTYFSTNWASAYCAKARESILLS